MNRFFTPQIALALAFSALFFASSPEARAETNTDPERGVARIGSLQEGSGKASEGGVEGESQPVDPLPQFSGNIPQTINQDRTHGINAPGTMIGPSPENGQPDPRFPNDERGSGSGGDVNGKSTAAGAAQAPTGEGTTPAQAQSGGTTSNLNEGLPSASKNNSGGNSGGASGGTGGGAGGKEYNVGGDARVGQDGSQLTGGPGDVVGQSAGAAPYVIAGVGTVILVFLGTMVWARAKKRDVSG